MKMKKYSMEKDEKTGLYRIIANKKIEVIGIKKGDKGGLIEMEENLEQDGDAWVSEDACVSGDARVYGDAWEKSPLYIQGTKFSLTNCKYGFLKIGCKEFSFDYWLENYKQIGKDNGFTTEEIEEYAEYIKLFKKIGK